MVFRRPAPLTHFPTYEGARCGNAPGPFAVYSGPPGPVRGPPAATEEAILSREIIRTASAPQAIGTYSQAVRTGNTVYLSGQIPLDPETMELVAGGFEAQVRRAFENLRAVCEASGGSLADVVKLGVYLTDLSHFPVVNEVMARFFKEPYPARAVLGVSALPKGAVVEMDAVLVLGLPQPGRVASSEAGGSSRRRRKPQRPPARSAGLRGARAS